MVAELRAEFIRLELRQYLLVTRLYESDLLLSPAAALRAPATPPPESEALAEFDLPQRAFRTPWKRGGEAEASARRANLI